MIHYLSEEQFKTIWGNYTENTENAYHDRKQQFKTKYPNINYIESFSPTSKSFWGRISGKEKYITMLLLQL